MKYRMTGSVAAPPPAPKVTEVPVCTLQRGARFKLWLDKHFLMGTYVESTACSARVLLDDDKPGRSFVTVDGTEVKLPVKKKLTHWYPGVEVEPTGEIVEVQVERETQIETGGDEMAALPGVQKAKAKSKVNGKAEPGAVRAAKKVADHPCLCGCGTLVAGRFSSGHDGRFYKFLRDLLKGEIKVNAIPPIARKEFGGTPAGAKAYLKSHGH